VVWRLTKGRLGNAWSAIRQDELAALSQGIHVARYKMIAFVISALMAGYAGALEAHLLFNIDPGDAQYGVTRAVQVLTFAVLGGSGFVLGPVVGAMIITLLPYVFSGAGPYINIVSGIFLIAVIIFRPQGIVGRGGLAIVRPRWWPKARVSAPSPG
jgi:branched-chain amino acid transport system permease protein